MSPLSRLFCLALLTALFASSANAGDWVHWRGPNQTGHSLEKNLPDSFDPATKTNVAWQQPFGGRSAPLQRRKPVCLQIAARFGEDEAVIDAQPGDRSACQGQCLQAIYDRGRQLCHGVSA